jgi:molybdopterin adenylyltransferase
MPKEGIFTRVVRPGTVRPGAVLTHQPRALKFWIVTVSDRASRGQYEDLSGPRIKELVEEFMAPKRWHLEIQRAVVPDDPRRLEAELQRAQDALADVVITSGGTGVGPKDITPEVVVMRCSKLIPGVMEHIRTKYGTEHPNALLSRGVAGVMGHGLIYTLPGSVRAVEEYMAEILKTVEHSVLMLHGLDVHASSSNR